MRKLVVLLAVVAGFYAVQVGVAYAAPCGTATSNMTLSADCDAPLTIGASGITVDLNGHSVVCNLPVVGIALPSTWSSDVVKNGTVRSGASNCVNGIVVGGDSNQFTSIDVHSATNQDVEVDGNSNRLTSMTADTAGNTGFIVFGNLNVIRRSIAANNNDDGVGFFVGSRNTISFSLVAGNADKGVIAGGSQSAIFANRISDNDRGIFLSDGSSQSRVFLNSVRRNSVGIQIDTSSSDLVVGNSSLNNVLDMRDDNPNCDSNFWGFNIFNTSNQSCIH